MMLKQIVSQLLNRLFIGFIALLWSSLVYSFDASNNSNRIQQNNPFIQQSLAKPGPLFNAPFSPPPFSVPVFTSPYQNFVMPVQTLSYPGPLETIARGTAMKILILGRTGSGKSTFLNTAANYMLSGSFGLRPEEQKIQVIIPTKFLKANSGYSHSESDVKNQGKSQTSEPIAYTFNLDGRSITFWDTPGMGDTEGLKRDEFNLKNIMEKVSQDGDLSGIILFFNGSETRETIDKIYAFQKLIGIIPDIARKNMIVVLTNTYKESSNFYLQPILDLGISKDRIFYMNNSVLASDPALWSEPRVALRLMQDWEDSMTILGAICTQLSNNSQAIGKEFKKMWALRSRVMRLFHDVKLKFSEIQETHASIDIFNAKFDQENAVAEDFKNYAQKAKVKSLKFIEDPNRHYSTICSVHHTTCHDQCDLKETTQIGAEIFTNCAAFHDHPNGSRCNTCSSRSNPCSFASHYHARGKFKMVEETLQDRLDAYKKRYENATHAAQVAQADISSAEAAIAQIKETIEEFTKKVEKTLNELKSICSSYDFLSELNATTKLLKQEAKTYRSIEAIKSAEAFIAALEMMADQLTQKPPVQSIANDKADAVESEAILSEESHLEKSKGRKLPSVKSFSKLCSTKLKDYKTK